jgi:hypothetical protein
MGGAGGMGGMNMVTTVMAFSVSAFFVLFVFTRLLCARLHLSRAAAAADRAAGDAFVVSAYNVERGIHGLEPSVVTTFPTVKLGDGGPQRPPVQEAQLRYRLPPPRLCSLQQICLVQIRACIMLNRTCFRCIWQLSMTNWPSSIVAFRHNWLATSVC